MIFRKKRRNLSVDLRTMARRDGLCDLWYKRWKDDTDIDRLLEMYVEGIDFCIEKDYPPLDFIRDNVSKSDLHRHNVYIDEDVSIIGDSGTYVFLGYCSGRIRFSGFSVANVYIRHESNINVTCDGYSKVFVSLYDDSDCNTIVRSETATVKEYDRK